MATNHEIRELLEATAYDVNGDKLGKVNEVYINDASGQPDFVEVNHGLFGMNSSLVPLRGHDIDGDQLKLAFEKDRIKDAPNVDADAHLSDDEQAQLYRHYGVEAVEDHAFYGDAGVAGAGVAGVAGAGVADADETVEVDHVAETAQVDHVAETAPKHAAAAPAAEAPAAEADELILSEERLNVSKERQATGEVKLRKHVVTDTETIEVPVQREEVTVERTPISAEEAANYNGTIGEEEASVIVHEERVVVSKETVPVEKVSLNKTTVEDTHTVSEEVAKERLEADGLANER
ncbi:PRC and DUF2382 domain-containing protein [Corynebacterium uterequi]|uniref:Conserved domain protein, TIGR02271+C111 n=1 Tax=Corynebacterium uterequi TaxID=1072256 RepID=A0A0G3HGN4_9CORY|nr:PRC and DUF2382 domain-containing protein [Corynebacterium uterequi]AKK11925.1 conserved domain protein, TIGR02271+C111 [Corynebacterium uterequi]